MRLRFVSGNEEGSGTSVEDLLNLSPLTLGCWVKGSACVCDGPGHDLPNTDWAVDARPRRFVVSCLAIEYPIGRREWRSHGTALGRVGDRGEDDG